MNGPRPLRRLNARIRHTDRKLFAAQAGHQSPVADALLPALTRVADHSVLWMGIGAGLAAWGGGRGRRSAARGLASVSLASLLANQVGKRLAPRKRPSLLEVPSARIARRIPDSGSFPSGHSASAAAFAVGASLEMPELSVPLGLLAAAVCWSRVYTGMHYPSDVVAGAAVGVGAAAVLARTFPTGDVQRRGVVKPNQVRLAARPTGRGVVIVVNQGSGPRSRAGHIGQLESALPDARIVPCDPKDVVSALHSAAMYAEILGISGGDGSVNAAASVARHHDLPLAVLPGGTFNHFAADLGIDSFQDTISAIRTGSAVQISVGRVTGSGEFDELFLNTASLGAYPEFVSCRERWQYRFGKPIASAIAARSVLSRTRPEEMLIDGERRLAGLMFIGNGSYEPQGFVPAWRPSLADGHLDLRLFDVRGRLPVTRLVVDFLLGRVGESPNFHAVLGDDIVVHRTAPGLLARDGEIGPAPAELHFGVHPRLLTVLAPVTRSRGGSRPSMAR